MDKRCIHCGKTKDTSEFHRESARKDGLCSHCKECEKIRAVCKSNNIPLIDTNTDPTKKFCPKCGQIKDKSAFSHDKTKCDDLHTTCRDCVKDNHRSEKLWTYRLTEGQYAILLKKQNGVCAICGQPETTVRNNKVIALAVDHSHVTNEVRGLLCDKCNRGLGYFKDSPILLEAAIKYLSK